MNPAQSLYDFLLDSKAGAAAGAALGTVRALNDSEGMAQQLQAVADVIAVRESLREMVKAGLPVDTYEKYLPDWERMVVGYPVGWVNQLKPDEAFPAAILDHLHTLAGWFATTHPTPSDSALSELRTFLADVLSLLEDDDTITAELKVYLGRLVREMQNAIDDDSLLQRFDLDEAGRRLWTALFAASAQTGSEERQRAWTKLADKLWWPSAAGIISSTPSIIAGVITASGSN